MITVELAIARIEEFQLHPLGFYYLRADAENGVGSRFHVWPAKEVGIPENQCHQHTFDIRSTILTGQMRSEVFNFEPTMQGEEKEFAVEYTGGKSLLRATGRMGNLKRFCEFDSKAGDSYFLHAGVIHRVSIMARPCVTTLETVDRAIAIFSYGKDVAEAPFNRRIAEQSEIREIETILHTLA